MNPLDGFEDFHENQRQDEYNDEVGKSRKEDKSDKKKKGDEPQDARDKKPSRKPK